MRISDALIPSLDLVQRTLAVDISYTISRMKVLERIPGNPIDIAYRWIDEAAVALMSRLPAFSRVVGLRASARQLHSDARPAGQSLLLDITGHRSGAPVWLLPVSGRRRLDL